MKCIKADLPSDLDYIELHVFADEHIGDELCDLKRLKERIAYVEQNPNAYCILNGDLIDNASRSSIGDIESRQFNIMEQMEIAVDLFGGLQGKILAITNGNHENRTMKKEGVSLSKLIALQLGISDRYSPAAAMIFLRFGSPINNHGKTGKKMLYTVFCNHGSGGGRSEGSKAVRLSDMASIVDADIYIHSHTHLPMIMKQGFFRTDKANSTVTNVTKLFVNTASNLDYGGYGEAQEYKPNSKDTPVIYLSGKRFEMNARL